MIEALFIGIGALATVGVFASGRGGEDVEEEFELADLSERENIAYFLRNIEKVVAQETGTEVSLIMYERETDEE